MRGSRTGYAVVAIWIVLAGGIGRADARVQRLQVHLRYALQRTQFRDTVETDPFRRTLWSALVETSGYLYHPQLLQFTARFALEQEHWQNLAVYGDLIARRRSPYDVFVRLFARRPVGILLQAYRRTRHTESLQQNYRADWTEQTWRAGIRLRLGRMPRIQAVYARRKLIFTVLGVERTVRLHQWSVDMDHTVGKYRFRMEVDRYDYDTPEWRDMFQVRATLTPTSGQTFRLESAYQIWGDLRIWRAHMYRLGPDTRWFIQTQWTRLPRFHWIQGHLRYDRAVSDDLRIQIEPGWSMQQFPGQRYDMGFFRSSLAWQFRRGAWRWMIVPHGEVAFHRTSDATGWGYATGMQTSLERPVLRGQLRLDASGQVLFRPIAPRYTARSVAVGSAWNGWIRNTLQTTVYIHRRWQTAVFVDSRIPITTLDAGVRVHWPRVRIQVDIQVADLVWNRIPYRRRSISLTLAPLRLGPVSGGFTQLMEIVNDQPYAISRGELRWRWGQFRFQVVSTYYNVIDARGRDWWDLRFRVERPIPLITRR